MVSERGKSEEKISVLAQGFLKETEETQRFIVGREKIFLLCTEDRTVQSYRSVQAVQIETTKFFSTRKKKFRKIRTVYGSVQSY